jgi:uncharacterized membrane protein
MTAQKNNKKNAFLQVILPLIFLIAAVGAAINYLVFNPATSPLTISETGDIATIYLLFLLIMPVFITIPLLAFIIFLMLKASSAVSSASIFITDKTSQANASTRKIASAAAAPFVEVSAWVYAINHIFSKKHTVLEKERDGK